MSSPSTLDQETEHRLEELFPQGDALIERLRCAGQARVFLISGPSGVGKDTVIEEMQHVYPDARYVVTSTSREMRPNEKPGVHYDFFERAELQRRIDAGEYIESAVVYGNLYGVPRRPIVEGLASGQHVIIKVDVQGFDNLTPVIDPIVSIFIAPESMAVLHDRLEKRNTETPEKLAKRFRTAARELNRAIDFSYVVFNEDLRLDHAVTEICGIIAAEERRPNSGNIWVSGA